MTKKMLTRWSMNLRFRPLKKKRETEADDKIRETVGLPTSIEQKSKQFLTFVLTQIGAFKRAGVKDE